jgi:phenylalanyl-tRNA synthetase beta chain
MKFSEQWLRAWVDPPVSTQELAEQLTMAGLEVDAVQPASPAFSNVVVGEVLSVEPHPDAEKLRVCRVATGRGEVLQIVCGAPNVRAGLKAPTALPGASLPGGMSINKARLRGVESHGMLCSVRDLGLADEHQGLMELPPEAGTGRDIRDYLRLDDQVIDVDLTPNRGDCLGMEGIAREVGALNRCAVTGPSFEEVTAEIDERLPLKILAPEACPRYLGRVIRDVDAAAVTPLWMQERLRRGGIRSLGPLVDVTNYVLLEVGQPMHGFDLDLLAGGIVVRYPQSAERITLLDGQTIDLDSDTLLISDHEKVLAIAGIMGGYHSGVGARTSSLFLECAWFTPAAIAGRPRRYAVQTDSSYRFERGVDPSLQHRAMQRATELLLGIVGGKAGPVTEASAPEHIPAPQWISLRAARIRRVLGMDPDPEIVVDILGRLGMKVENNGQDWRVLPPSFRFDIAMEADLIEEIGRIYGYNRLPATPLSGQTQMSSIPEDTVEVSTLCRLLVDRGYQEALTYSFVDPRLQRAIDPEHGPLPLNNPISSEMSVMRTSLWPGLVKALQYNLNRQQNRLRFFEYGLRYLMQDSEITQENVVSGIVTGTARPESWDTNATSVDFFDVKKDIQAMLSLTRRASEFTFHATEHPALHPGQAAAVRAGGRTVGLLGCIHPVLARELDLPPRTYLFEIEFSSIKKRKTPRYHEISRFPAIRRDIALVVDAAVSAQAIQGAIAEISPQALQKTVIFDVYQGEGIESGRKSIALGLILQDSSRTLTEGDVEDIIDRVTTRLSEEFGATLRE